MKILIDARFYGLENTGIGRYVVNLIDNLQRIDKENKYVILLKRKYFEELNLPQNWQKVKIDINHYSISEQTKLIGIISKQNPDLVHFLHFNVPLFYKKPFVVTIHDLLMHRQTGAEATTLSRPLYYLKRFGYKKVFASAVNNSSKIIVPSTTVKKELLSYYKLEPRKIKVTYEGVDDKTFPRKVGTNLIKSYGIDLPYFIYAGNAYPHKNLKRAIEAILALNKKGGKGAKLVIVSARNIFVERLHKTIKEMGTQDFVKLLGFVSDRDLGVLYKNSLAFVFPSISEGFGLPGLEAIAAGTLLIASDIPVFREIYKDKVIYFNPYDFSDIERVMDMVLSLNDTQRQSLIKDSQTLLKNYSWSKMAKETLKIYEEVLQKK